MTLSEMFGIALYTKIGIWEVIRLKDILEYGVLKDDEWGLCWERPPFKIWVTPEEISPFFIVEHYPYSLSLLLKIKDNFKIDVFHKIGLQGSSSDWEKLSRRLIEKYEEENSGIDIFMFDSDEDVFCIFSDYVDDLMKFARTYLRAVCNDEKTMIEYLKSNDSK